VTDEQKFASADFQRMVFHECGHAVAQYSFGWKLHFVAIGGLAENGQHAWSGSATAEKDDWAGGAVIALSGPLAECRFLGVSVSDDELAAGKLPLNSGIDLGGWLIDASHAQRLCGTEGIQFAIQRARNLIAERSVWNAVNSLAAELCRPERLIATPLRGMPEAVRKVALGEFAYPNHDHRLAKYCCIWGDEASRIIGPSIAEPTKTLSCDDDARPPELACVRDTSNRAASRGARLAFDG
jgi:hypothetical protein